MALPYGWLATGVSALVSLSACVAPPAPPARTDTTAARADMPQVAPAPTPIDLKPALDKAGLVMIETQNTAPLETYMQPPPVLGRKPRPQVQVAAEPLQMVETKNN